MTRMVQQAAMLGLVQQAAMLWDFGRCSNSSGLKMGCIVGCTVSCAVDCAADCAVIFCVAGAVISDLSDDAMTANLWATPC